MAEIDTGNRRCASDDDCRWTACDTATGVCLPSSVRQFATCVYESQSPPFIRASITGTVSLDEFLDEFVITVPPSAPPTPFCWWDASITDPDECTSPPAMAHMGMYSLAAGSDRAAEDMQQKEMKKRTNTRDCD